MYGNTNTIFSRAADFLGRSTSPDPTLPLILPSAPFLPPNLLFPDQLGAAEFESVPALNSEVGNSSSCSGCSSYGSPTSLASHCTQSLSQRPAFIQRSVSSHSLMKNGFRQLFSSAPGFVDSDDGPVRRVFSTGDLQRIHMVQHSHRSDSPLSNENSIIIESMSKACRYSPEEKKERIERYRSKRNQRNFNKKIKYACRKTLADSRPRIRGRFARNDEIDQKSSQVRGEEDEEEDDDWINFIATFSANMAP
ncbi:zinc finger protein CONSTANS-LIKE 9 isoform X2 [Alnus glutinosa]|uniref:zinc finger protein CONSTANS-LIKE 9 isoform X2 n=1 Tax=Alnus glutinosa TaxID=3517 RepID=UPI002D78FB4B|nr:zinc finger protein CONSTANS-LIKE 9 isoform X2 [Alnus glutinosa]